MGLTLTLTGHEFYSEYFIRALCSLFCLTLAKVKKEDPNGRLLTFPLKENQVTLL